MEMKTITIVPYKEIPDKFTGIVIHLNNDGKFYFANGKFHRDDGPAVDYGDYCNEYWLHDRYYSSKEEWFNSLTSEQQENFL